MHREVVLAMFVTGCGVPVDIGMLEDTTSGGSGGPVTEDATLTESMTGQLPMTSMTAESSSSDTADEPPPAVRRDFAILEGPAVDTGGNESETGEDSATTAMSTSATSATSTSTTAGESGDPEVGTLSIFATTGTASCEDPFGFEPCPATWTYSFRLPPELASVGATGRLEDFGGFAAERGPEPVDCSGGGGSLVGNFEITAIDETRVAGRMFDLELTMWETEVDFDAPICGA